MREDILGQSQVSKMPYNAVEEPIPYDGGCLCSRLRYRITFPADSEYPIAKHW
jgi:hypothetical protein